MTKLPDWGYEWTHEKLLDLLLMNVNRVTAIHRHYGKVSTKDLDSLCNIQIAIEQELQILPREPL